MDDWELLQLFAKNRSETAFAGLVHRHLNWVHSAALRQVGDPHLAQDVAQAVFVLLARKAGDLRRGTILSGWLFRTTHFVAASALRSERRRRAREEAASTMMPTTAMPDDDDNEVLWNQLAPHLDQAVAALSQTDRSAILLRFYERKSLREVGHQLGLSEDAAKKRVTRAIEKLRRRLTRRGAVLGGTALAVELAEHTVQAAPQAFALSVLQSATASVSASATLPHLVRETLHSWRLANLKLIAGIAAVSVAGAALVANTVLWHPRVATARSSITEVEPVGQPAVVSPTQTTPSTTNATVTGNTVSNGVIDVFVMEKETKQPLADARVGGIVQGNKRAVTVESDDAGHYRAHVPDRNPSHVAIWAHKEGFVPLRVDWYTHKGADPLPDSFTFAMERATSIGGVVQDEQGKPIAEVSVSPGFSTWPDENRIRIDSRGFEKITTDVQGRWRFDQAPADLRNAQFSLKHPNYRNESYPGLPDHSKPPDAQLRNMTAIMVMNVGQALAGVVLDQQGRPVPGASLVLGDSMYLVTALKTNTDSMGAFRFNNTAGGSSLLTVQASGYAPEMRRIEAGQDTSSLEFRLERGHVIKGQLVDEQQRPIPGVYVSVDSWRNHQVLQWHGSTDTNGLFEWNGAPPDDVKFEFLKTGYRRAGGPMHPDAENAAVTLGPPFLASGSATDADTGKPIAAFRVSLGRLFDGQTEPSWSQQDQRSFSDGQYKYEIEFPGRYVLRVDSEGYATEISPAFDFKDNGFSQDFRLARAAWIQGVVRATDGHPLADATVILVTLPRTPLVVENGLVQDQRESVGTDDEGRFKFPPQDKPSLVLVLHNQGYAQAPVDPEGRLPDLVITPWARVEGEMYIGAQPAAQKKVNAGNLFAPFDSAVPRVFFEANAMTDDNGHFMINHVPVGRLKVGRWILLNERTLTFTTTHAVEVQTAPGQAAHATIGGTGQPVIGQFTLPANWEGQVDWSRCSAEVHTKHIEPAFPDGGQTMTEPERRAWLQQWLNSDEGRAYQQAKLTAPEIHSYPFAVGVGGSFRVEDVPPGTYQVEAELNELPSNGTSVVQQPIAHIRHEFTVPDLPNGRTDVPLDLGYLDLQSVTPQK